MKYIIGFAVPRVFSRETVKFISVMYKYKTTAGRKFLKTSAID